MKKSDKIAALTAGFLIAILSLSVLKNLGISLGYFSVLWIIALPLLSLFGLWISLIIGKKFSIIIQIAKFVLVGGLNTLVDLGILNFLILIFGIATGIPFLIFKSFSFLAAVTNSYFWNKHWTFKDGQAKPSDKLEEMGKFFTVSLIGFAINVGTAFFIVNIIGPQFNLNLEIWANIGALTAVFVGMIWNFLGFKYIVFNNKKV